MAGNQRNAALLLRQLEFAIAGCRAMIEEAAAFCSWTNPILDATLLKSPESSSSPGRLQHLNLVISTRRSVVELGSAVVRDARQLLAPNRAPDTSHAVWVRRTG